MFTSFFSIGQMPNEWRKSIVAPIYKSGLSQQATNYRPIALKSVACKLMERVIVTEMLRYLRSNGIISKQQHGFLSMKSTTTNLIETINDWSTAIYDNDKKSVAVAYINYTKAFDTVCQSKLLIKLEVCGITGILLKWITSFLSDRIQCTRIGQTLSSYNQLCSGIIQESLISPLLFVVYINDSVDVFTNDSNQCTCKLYADDVKLYSVIKTGIECSILQDGLNKLYEWSDKWQLRVLLKKCNVIFVSNCDIQAELYLGYYPVCLLLTRCFL